MPVKINAPEASPDYLPFQEEIGRIEVEEGIEVIVEDNKIVVRKEEEPVVEEEEEEPLPEPEEPKVVPLPATNEEAEVVPIPNATEEPEVVPLDEVEEDPVEEKPEPVKEESGNWIDYEFTHYTATCEGCSGITATGYDVRNTAFYNGMRVIAVNPAIIPYNTVVKLRYPNGTEETAIALDTGGAIRARSNLIDVLVSTREEALSKGRVHGQIQIMGAN